MNQVTLFRVPNKCVRRLSLTVGFYGYKYKSFPLMQKTDSRFF